MKSRIDLLLVNPGNRSQTYGKLGVSLAGIEPPLWCGLTAAFIRENGFSVRIIDADAENLSAEEVAEKTVEFAPLLVDIVVLGTNPSASSTPKMTAVSETVNEVRKKAPDIRIALSGLHPSALPEGTLREEKVDFILQGEAFRSTLELLRKLTSGDKNFEIEGVWLKKDGEILSGSPALPLNDLDALPSPAWDLLPMNKYRAHNWHCFDNLDERSPYGVIYTSFGCPSNCSFCPVHTFYGKPGIRLRSIDRVMYDIDILVRNYGVRNIKIMDELFVLRKDRILKFCDLIIERGYDLNMWCYARVDTVDELLLNKMKQAGINWISYGFESASETVRSGVNKKTGDKKTEEAIQKTFSANIHILANFIFGLPDDSLKTMQETLDMAKEFNFEYVNFYSAMAYPGSMLYEEARNKGTRLPEKWHGYAQLSEESLPLPTKHLSSEEVLQFRDEAFIDYFSDAKYLNMITQKFGQKVREHIEGMLKHKIQRKYVSLSKGHAPKMVSLTI